MKFKKVLLLALLCSSVLVGCEEHPSFKTSVDAVEGCKKELAELKEMDDVSVENLANKIRLIVYSLVTLPSI